MQDTEFGEGKVKYLSNPDVGGDGSPSYGDSGTNSNLTRFSKNPERKALLSSFYRRN